MKLILTLTIAIHTILFLLSGGVLAMPFPQGPLGPLDPPGPPALRGAISGPSSLVLLQLSSGQIARCTLPNGRTRAKADMVSSKLVASGKMTCKDALHRGSGKTLWCEQGQLTDDDEAIETLMQACEVHEGLRSVV
ncbi:hypothetical protein PSEUBRA_002232 [Kalmanozyma brasiliensis GHG001]|uniref:Uncharacterized protein n=1 Tax=Kalmanozyma brasiliensis (strain GHG001) TaxID=1365824 RepID=V5EXE5_KALBG|nr:uncharacterized protein PSEUBRA_002232 [Kalmanozyma brasiliensis GHG001]EST08148.1 hypothetical protein PSEUBRA_002232 [Kalmanozyma brasiliensis GHG001]